jgi:LacI family transcriptional regulator
MATSENLRRRPLIGVIVNNVGGYSRGVVRGITSFAFARAWTCRVQGVNEHATLDNFADYDGLIVQARTPEAIEKIDISKKPVVNVSSALPPGTLPSVASDDLAVGRLAADYFLKRGYRHFSFVTQDLREFVNVRHRGFADRLAESGYTCLRTTDGPALQDALATTQRPIAVMGANDRAALAALDACRTLELKVPEHVAVLGVDNDDLVQSLAYPPLSTINTARQRIGFEAAAMLETLMLGQTIAKSHLLVPPSGVIERQSTNVLAIADEDVADAMRFIAAHAGRRIDVADVLREVPLSRRQLERKFRTTVGRSILDEILRCRIDRAKQLLSDTELALPQVADASGFASASYFSVVFKRETGTTPANYRGDSGSFSR